LILDDRPGGSHPLPQTGAEKKLSSALNSNGRPLDDRQNGDNFVAAKSNTSTTPLLNPRQRAHCVFDFSEAKAIAH
jgi:hypothetical protein